LPEYLRHEYAKLPKTDETNQTSFQAATISCFRHEAPFNHHNNVIIQKTETTFPPFN